MNRQVAQDNLINVNLNFATISQRQSNRRISVIECGHQNRQRLTFIEFIQIVCDWKQEYFVRTKNKQK